MNQLAIEFRDAGIKAARDHAEAESPGWGDRALSYVKEYACYHQEFTGEDVRLYSEGKGFEIPPHKRAWGSILRAAVKRGIILKVGTRQVSNPRAHCAIATLWRAV